ncbi:alpha-tocopherol transfer protein-like [Caerostris extrusa]|uniref:Alpha-tocopherol transfer protein-like n=1 Tax=Caerostris extrusa TaxID=172846 RepID=A0AAV4TS45_CAEEX|nr:alpha-tocopherol transfer protein-like [Caerostris extrusa]
MIIDDPDLVSRSDDAFLLRFLRARKFDYTRSFNLLQNYYMMRVKNANIFKDFTPSSLKHVHQLNLQGFLPYRDPEGRSIFVFRGGMWDPSLCSADDLFRANVICLEKQIDDPLTQINGVVAILDMKMLGFHHIRHFSPSHALKIVSQQVLKRLKENLHTWIQYENFAFHIPPDILPAEFDGLLGPFSNKEFIEALAQDEEIFIKAKCTDTYHKSLKKV